MSFANEIRIQAFRAKDKYPKRGNTIDKIVEDFTQRQIKGEFQLWDWSMIAEEFHKEVDKQCVEHHPFRSSKRSYK